jgi:hypothetical protein
MPETVISKYPFILVTVATRKEGLTRKEFWEHNETKYAPLLKKTAGKVHPLTWTRRYHIDDDEGPTGIPKHILGTGDCLDWDCFGEMVCVVGRVPKEANGSIDICG